MRRTTRLALILTLLTLGATCLAIAALTSPCIFLAALEESNRQRREENWERRMAYPIPEETVEGFCNGGLIPIDIADCNDPDVVIPLGAIPDIVRANVDFEHDTYGYVTSIFGEYERFCETEMDCSDSDQYRCSYLVDGYSFFIFYDCSTHRILDVHWDRPDGS